MGQRYWISAAVLIVATYVSISTLANATSSIARVQSTSLLADVAQTQTSPTSGSVKANEYCKKQADLYKKCIANSQCPDITTVTYTDTEGTFKIFGHCTAEGTFQATQYQGMDGRWHAVSQAQLSTDTGSITGTPGPDNAAVVTPIPQQQDLNYGPFGEIPGSPEAQKATQSLSETQSSSEQENTLQKVLQNNPNQIKDTVLDKNLADPKFIENSYALQACDGLPQGCNPKTIGADQTSDVGASQAIRDISANNVAQTIKDLDSNAQVVTMVGGITKATTADGTVYYFDSSGQVFMRRDLAGEDTPSTLNLVDPATKNSMPLYPVLGLTDAQKDVISSVVDTPEKYKLFYGEFYGNTANPYGTTFQPDWKGVGDYSYFRMRGDPADEDIRYYTDPAQRAFSMNENGSSRVSEDTKQFVYSMGDKVYGTTDINQKLMDYTNGKISLNMTPDVNPPSSGLFNPDSVPRNLLQPNPPDMRAQTAQQVYNLVTSFPQELWQNPAIQNVQVDMSGVIAGPNLPPKQEGGGVVQGAVALTAGPLWVNPSISNVTGQWGYDAVLGHELIGHTFDKPFFPPDEVWCQKAYSSSCGPVYAGENAAIGIEQGKLAFVFQGQTAGFVDQYGTTDVSEDKATIVQGMMTNYAAMQKAAQTDPILAAKMGMVQSSLETASNGAMNQAWWENRTPIDPTWKPSSKVWNTDILTTILNYNGVLGR